MDATPYEWVLGQIWHLQPAIDDSTGRISGGWFDTEETLNAYYHVFHQILTTYGIPYKFFTDRCTIFTLPSRRGTGVAEPTKYESPDKKARANVSIILGQFQKCLT